MRRRRSVGAVLIAVLAGLTFAHGVAEASLAITGVGGWTSVVDASDLVAGAGTDLTATYESAANAVLVSVTPAHPSDKWRVDVRRADSAWPSAFHLYVRRTGDGAGRKTPYGGTTYQEVGVTDVPLFYGQDDSISVPIQLRLTGMSIHVDPSTYSTGLVFTLVPQ